MRLQRQAVELAADGVVLVLTGGPVPARPPQSGHRGPVPADGLRSSHGPTGRAAKRMSELTGMEA